MKMTRSVVGLLSVSAVFGILLAIFSPVAGGAGESGPYDPPPLDCWCTPNHQNYTSGPDCPASWWEVWDDYYRTKLQPCDEYCGSYFVGCFDPNG